MSCTLELFGYIHDWKKVKNYLDNQEDGEESGWRNDWDWEDDTDKDAPAPADKASSNGSKAWLQSCKVAHSPAADLIVIGKGTKSAFLKGNWDDKQSQMKYTPKFQGILGQEGEFLSAIVCIPLISKKASSGLTGLPDWTCVLVGFSSGWVRMYSEEGLLLFQQQFQPDEACKSFKVKMYEPASSSSSIEHEQLEELILIYETVLVTLDGFEVFQTLRACRSHLAKIHASALHPSPVNSPPMTCKKWEFDVGGHSDFSVADCDAAGLKTPSVFDQFYNGSVIGGLGSKCAPVPPSASEFITTGKHPFVSFQYAQERSRAPVLTDIAYAMANSLVNVATDWWRSKSQTQKTAASPSAAGEDKANVAAKMKCRFGFRDSERSGFRLSISPCHKFCAVVDTLGRVLLYDLVRGLAVRMWKGYREAEVSWIVEHESSSKSQRKSGSGGGGNRKATFLIIYARARSILEIFPMQQGALLATFNVTKGGMLLGTTHGLMGINEPPTTPKKSTPPLLQTLFVDEEARLFTFTIPFHLALEKASSKLKDTHLLKSLQQQIKQGAATAVLLEIFDKISAEAAVLQAFRFLTQKCRHGQLQEVLDEYIQKLGQADTPLATTGFELRRQSSTSTEDSGRIRSVLNNLRALTDLYEMLVKSSKSLQMETSETLEPRVNLSGKEKIYLSEMRAKSQNFDLEPRKTKVKFVDSELPISSSEFFSCCAIEFDSSKHAPLTSKEVQLNFSSNHFDGFGRLLLSGAFSGAFDVFKWGEFVRNSKLSLVDLFRVSLRFWIANSGKFSDHLKAMDVLFDVIKTLCELEGVSSKFNEISGWWEEIRQELAKSSQLFEVYSFAVTCRAVSIQIAGEIEPQVNFAKSEETKGKETEIPEETWEWESLPLDLLKFNAFLKQIEDLSILSDVITAKEKLECPLLPILSQPMDPLSATSLLEKGRGAIAETVGKWLTTIGLDPKLISGLEDPEKAIRSPSDDENVVLDLVRILLDNFQVSIASPSVVLANYCWEYCLEWSRSSGGGGGRMEYLTAAFQCVSSISCSSIRLGMLSLMWHSIIAKRLSKEIVASDSEFATRHARLEFLQLCSDLLELFMETPAQEKPGISSQAEQSHWSTSAASVSLVDLALAQPPAQYEMLDLHHQLVRCAQLMQEFQIRKPKVTPNNMFDTRSKMALFQNLTNSAALAHRSSAEDVDLSLKNLREEFLCLVVTGAVGGIPEDLEATSSTDSVVPAAQGVKECDAWIQKVFELGRSWALDLDVLRIVQVCEYYSHGFDFLGEAALPAVRGKDVLGTKLLVIAGMRVSYLIRENSACVPEMLSSVSTNLSNWLDHLDYSVLKRLFCTKESIQALVNQIVRLIPESSYDFKLAEQLLASSAFL